MMNNWKRPRQTMNSATLPTQAIGRTGPAGAAAHPDLMPVGGFNRNMNQRQGVPTSGRGAANINRNTNTYAYNNPPSGGRFPTSVNQRNFVQNSSGPYQQHLGVNSMQNRFPSKSVRSWTQPYNPTGSCDQIGPYFDEASLCLDGDNPNPWNGGQRVYNRNGVIANKNGAPPYGQTYMQQHQQQQQQQQTRSQFKTTRPGRGGSGRHQRGNFRTSTYTSPQSVQAHEITDKGITTFPVPTPVLPGPNTQTATKSLVKVTSPNKTAVSEVKKSLHFLTVDVAGVKRWSNFKENVQIMFEVFGHLDSAVARDKKDSKEFLIRDDKRNDLSCVFYEIDRQLPKMTRGQWYRIVGTYDGGKQKFHCLSIRVFQSAEGYLAPVLSRQSAETMCKLTQNLTEA